MRKSASYNTMSTSMLGGNSEFLPLDDEIVRGCPGKLFLNLVILLEVDARAWEALRDMLDAFLGCLLRKFVTNDPF